jgi:hypothetical protein
MNVEIRMSDELPVDAIGELTPTGVHAVVRSDLDLSRAVESLGHVFTVISNLRDDLLEREIPSGGGDD